MPAVLDASKQSTLIMYVMSALLNFCVCLQQLHTAPGRWSAGVSQYSGLGLRACLAG